MYVYLIKIFITKIPRVRGVFFCCSMFCFVLFKTFVMYVFPHLSDCFKFKQTIVSSIERHNIDSISSPYSKVRFYPADDGILNFDKSKLEHFFKLNYSTNSFRYPCLVTT